MTLGSRSVLRTAIKCPDRIGRGNGRVAEARIRRVRPVGRRNLVPKAGLEPARLAPHAPQTCVSAISPLRLPVRMLKKPSSFVLTSLGDSTYASGTRPLLTRCGLAGKLFEHSAVRPSNDGEGLREAHYRRRAKFLSIKETSGRIGPLSRRGPPVSIEQGDRPYHVGRTPRLPTPSGYVDCRVF